MSVYLLMYSFFFFKQKTAYDMRISDWSSDVCSSDLSFRLWYCCNPEWGQVSLQPLPKWRSFPTIQFPALPGPEQSRHQHSPSVFLIDTFIPQLCIIARQ